MVKIKTKFDYIHDAWKQFDRSTAYGCASRGIKFDAEKCKATWKLYNDIIETYYNFRFNDFS